MKEKVVFILLVVLVCGCYSCKTTEEINSEIGITKDEIESINSSTILLTSQFDALTRSLITYNEFDTIISPVFDDNAAKANYMETIGGMVIFEDCEHNLVYANSITSENQMEYLHLIDKEIKDGNRWFLLSFQLSNVVIEDDEAKIITRIKNKMGFDFYYLYIYDLNNDLPRVSHFSHIDYLNNPKYFSDFAFSDEMTFDNFTTKKLENGNIQFLIKTTVSGINRLSKALIDYENLHESIEIFFSDYIAKDSYLQIAGNYIIGAKGDSIITSKALTSNNLDEYYHQLKESRMNHDLWYYTGYQISELNYSDDAIRLLVKLKTSEDFDIIVLFSFSNSFPNKISHVAHIQERNQQLIEEYQFLKEVIYFEE